jgi:hypothetical protein
MVLQEELQKKWKPVLEHDALPGIKDSARRGVTAILLENTEKALREASHYSGQFLTEAGVPATNHTGTGGFGDGVSNFDPVLISLVRRAMPNLIAYDICGVQPMTGPTGLIFAMRSKYASMANSAAEAFYNEANTAYSNPYLTGANTIGDKHVGTVPDAANNAANGAYNFGTGMATASAEALGEANTTGGIENHFPEMAFSIEKVSVEAKTRALKAEYTMELAQDLKAIHGLDAETELANILSAEILAEINREVVRTINITAIKGGLDCATPGTFNLDVDANGRWSVEKFKGMMFKLEQEANAIAKATRRGKGNIVICSSDVASALQMAGVLDYTPALNSNNLNVDDTGATFAGVLNGRFKVYVDPYTTGNYFTMGYKGASAFDAGLFYCPYVPLQMVRAVDQNSFQPKIGFKTRYGMVANPFAEGSAYGNGRIAADTNVYYRRVLVQNLL